MRIRNIKINDFGILKNISREFTEGISIIYGENEAGKSTMALFIRCMLYGLKGNKKTGNLSLRKRILPFNGVNASGSMTVTEDGVDYLITRVFGQTLKSDTVKIFNAVTGSEVLTDKEPGELFLNMDESVFLRSIFIDENDNEISAKNTEELKSKLTGVVISGDPDNSFKRAEKELSDEIKAISNLSGRGKPGAADILLTKIDELKYQLSQALSNDERINAGLEKIRIAKNQVNELKIEKSSLDAEKASLRTLKMRDDYSDLRVLIDRADYLKSEVDKNKQGIKSSDLSELVSDFRELTLKYNTYKSSLDQYNDLNSKLEEASSEINGETKQYFSEENENSIRISFDEIVCKERTADLIKNPESDSNKENWVEIQKFKALKDELDRNIKLRRLLNVIFLIPIIMIFATSDMGLITAVVLVIPIVYIFLRIRIGKKIKKSEELKNSMETSFNSKFYGIYKHTISDISELIYGKEDERSKFFNSNQNEINEIRNKLYQEFKTAVKSEAVRYESFSLADYLKAEEDFDSKRFGFSNLNSSVSEMYPTLLDLKKDLDEKNRELDIRLKEIKKDSLFNGTNHRYVTDELENMLILQKMSEDKMAELEKTRSKISTFFEREEDVQNVDLMIDAIHEELEAEEKLESRSLSVLEKIHEKEKEILIIQNELDILEAGKRPGEIISEIELKTNEMNELIEEKKVSELALKVLRECNEEMERDYLPAVSGRTGEILNRLTKGKHSNIIMDNNFNISYEDNTGFVSQDYLSKGTKDLLWFGLRMSLYDILKNGEEVPLIFDDSFIHMDDIRLESVLVYLKQIAERAQILIFTCQSRVENTLEYLAEK